MKSITYIDHKNQLTKHVIEHFITTGLCYIKLPADIHQALLDIRQQALNFFHLPESKKSLHTINNGNGYLNQRKSSNGLNANIQRYIYRDNIKTEQLQKVSKQIFKVHRYLRTALFEPLLKHITDLLELPTCFNNTTKHPDQTLSLIYYPASKHKQQRIKNHKDISVFTALWAPESGLYSYVDNNWHQASHNEEYIAIQIGDALSMMTNGLCSSLAHKVAIEPNRERFSLASFFGPNTQSPLINYMTGEVIDDKFSTAIENHLKKTYDDSDNCT